jgi:hypothetical protein
LAFWLFGFLAFWLFGGIAQFMVEQWTENPRVIGSIPILATIKDLCTR